MSLSLCFCYYFANLARLTFCVSHQKIKIEIVANSSLHVTKKKKMKTGPRLVFFDCLVHYNAFSFI